MIRGSIENLIKWLDLNEIETWEISASRSKQDNQKVFERKDDEPRDAGIARMREVLDLSDNTILYVTGRKKNQGGTTGLYMETWTNRHEQPVVNSQAIGAIPAVQQGVDQNTVNDMVNRAVMVAVEQEHNKWRLADLERREKELADAKKEFEKSQAGLIGTAIKMGGPWLQQIASAFAPRPAVAIGAVPSDYQQATQQPVIEPHADKQIKEADPESEVEQKVAAPESLDELTAEEQALNEALNRYAEFDPEYCQVLLKFINAVVSGRTINLMNGLVQLDYKTVKDNIMQL